MSKPSVRLSGAQKPVIVVIFDEETKTTVKVTKMFDETSIIKHFENKIYRQALSALDTFSEFMSIDDLYQEFSLVVLNVFRKYNIELRCPFEALLKRSFVNKYCVLKCQHKLYNDKRIRTVSTDAQLSQQSDSTFETFAYRQEEVKSSKEKNSIELFHDISAFVEHLKTLRRAKDHHMVRLETILRLLSLGFNQRDVARMIEAYNIPDEAIPEYLLHVPTQRVYRLFDAKRRERFYSVIGGDLICFYGRHIFRLDEFVPYTMQEQINKLNVSAEIEKLKDVNCVGELVRRTRHKIKTSGKDFLQETHYSGVTTRDRRKAVQQMENASI